jgi:4-amino-4-deoxy-L-arabinose transferase-like glycosyltransferase
MNQKLRILMLFIILAASQLFILFFHQWLLGLLLIISAIVVSFWGRVVSYAKDVHWFKLSNLRYLFLTAGIFLAIFGGLTVDANPVRAIYFFIIGGLLIYYSVVKGVDICPPGFIENGEKQKFSKWELLYMVAALISCYFLYFYKLSDIPQGAAFHEGVMSIHTKGMSSHNFVMYVADSQANWSSFVFYQGYIFNRIFGWNIGSLRIPSAIYSTLTVICLYFLMRKLTSPLTAFITSALFMVCGANISVARQFYPVSVLFLPPLLGFYFILEGVSAKKWYYFVFSGIACGVSLLGYLPGRTCVLILLLWMVFAFMVMRKMNYLKYLPAFLAAYVITAWPVIYSSIINPVLVWGYVGFVDVNRNAGIFSRISQFVSQIVPQAQLFFTSGDMENIIKTGWTPILDNEPLIKILFPAGLVIILLSFFRLVPMYMLLFLVLALLPSMMSGYALAKRSMAALPVIFMIGGYAFEYIRRSFVLNGRKVLEPVLALIMVTAVGWSAGKSINGYFNLFLNDPGVKIAFNDSLYRSTQFIKKHSGAAVFMERQLEAVNAVSLILVPEKAKVTELKSIEQIIFQAPESDEVIILPPFMEPSLSYLKKLLPLTEVEYYREKNTNARFFKSGLTPWDKYFDIYNPFVSNISLFVKASDLDDLRSSLADIGDKGSLINIVNDNFSAKYTGKAMDLAGAFYITANQDKVMVSIGWAGWQFKVDGIAVDQGAEMAVSKGIHFFEIMGKVPSNRAGKLPLSIKAGKVDIISEKLMAGITMPYGLKASFSEGDSSWDKRPVFSQNQFIYLKRYYDFEVPPPYSITLNGRIRVDDDGVYAFIMDPYIRSRIFVNGEKVYDSIKPSVINTTDMKNISLKKNVKYTLRAELAPTEGNLGINTFILRYKINGMQDFSTVPVEWVTIY